MSLLLISLFIIQGSNPVFPKEFSKLGNFDNVSTGDEGEHCDGTSLSVWKTSDSTIIGLMDIHAGLCGDPPCSLIEGKIRKNRIHFKSSDTIDFDRYSFSGKISANHVTGSLNGDSVKLNRETEKYLGDYDKEFQSWCKFWSKVHRCKGVKEYCQTFQIGTRNKVKP